MIVNIQDHIFPTLCFKRLQAFAQAPSVAHLGEDIGYDLYASQEEIIPAGATVSVHTGISIEFIPRCGARIGTRSSMAKKGIIAVGGEIDAGYRGEIIVMLHNLNHAGDFHVDAGCKIAQLIAVPEVILYTPIEEDELSPSSRGGKGFGSSGK